jgi:hypothetical protein
LGFDLRKGEIVGGCVTGSWKRGAKRRAVGKKRRDKLLEEKRYSHLSQS